MTFSKAVSRKSLLCYYNEQYYILALKRIGRVRGHFPELFPTQFRRTVLYIRISFYFIGPSGSKNVMQYVHVPYGNSLKFPPQKGRFYFNERIAYLRTGTYVSRKCFDWFHDSIGMPKPQIIFPQYGTVPYRQHFSALSLEETIK